MLICYQTLSDYTIYLRNYEFITMYNNILDFEKMKSVKYPKKTDKDG